MSETPYSPDTIVNIGYNMNLNDADLDKLTGIMTAVIVEQLGGVAGDDYSSWVDDIVQDCYVSILETAGEAEDIYNIASVIAYRKAISFKKGELRRREIEDEHGGKINSVLTGQSAELLAADPLEVMAYEEMRDRLDGLSPLLYSTTYRHYINGLSVADIADSDAVTEDVVYKRLQRARDFVSDGDDDGQENE